MSGELEERIAGEIVLSNEPGATIRKWREEFGLSQHQLAEEMSISHSVISDYESGRRKSPGIAVIRKMVEAFISIDKENGSPTIRKYSPDAMSECIIAMSEFKGGVSMDEFISAIGGVNLNSDKLPPKTVYGYTIVDSIKTIMLLGSADYMKIYGWSTERALIFTDVHFGRSPMIAIRAHPLTPAVVVYQKPDQVDPLAVKLSKLEKIPLVTTNMEIENIVKNLEKYKEGI